VHGAQDNKALWRYTSPFHIIHITYIKLDISSKIEFNADYTFAKVSVSGWNLNVSVSSRSWMHMSWSRTAGSGRVSGATLHSVYLLRRECYSNYIETRSSRPAFWHQCCPPHNTIQYNIIDLKRRNSLLVKLRDRDASWQRRLFETLRRTSRHTPMQSKVGLH